VHQVGDKNKLKLKVWKSAYLGDRRHKNMDDPVLVYHGVTV
jgi:hypothetical protein